MKTLQDGLQRYYAENERSLDKNLPELESYLQPDLRVRDVGVVLEQSASESATQ